MQVAQRPNGVTILAVLAFLFGIIGLATWISMLTGSPGPGAAVAAPIGGLFIWWLVRVVTSLLQVVFGYGAWTLKPWSWPLGVTLQTISIAISIIYVLAGSNFVVQALNILISALILYYLFTPEVKHAFSRT